MNEPTFPCDGADTDLCEEGLPQCIAGSPESRRKVEDELVAEVLAAFLARAEIVRKSLGARAYEIVQISINTQGVSPMRRAPMMAMEMDSAASVRAPAVEGGSSRIVVHANGTIEFD